MTPFENVVIENKINDLLTTNVDLANYVTLDNSLTSNAGMKIDVHTYTSTGDVEKLAKGEGNTKAIEPSYATTEYTVGTVQGRFIYQDEDAMTDPVIIDAGIRGAAQKMVNQFTADAIAEFDKATLSVSDVAGFDIVVDAIAELNTESEGGLFLLINPKTKATFRKNLGDDLKYSEGFDRTGYIGTVAGVPVIVSKAVPENTGYLASREAVTLFTKKATEIENDREPNTRTNTMYIRRVYVVALTDATKVVKLTFTAN